MSVDAIFPLLAAPALLPPISLFRAQRSARCPAVQFRTARSSRGLSRARAEHMITARSAAKGKPEQGHFIFSQFMEDSQQVIAEMSKGKEGEFSL